MRIAFLLNHFPVLSQTFVLNQITGLIDRGHQVDIFAKTPGKDTVFHKDVQKYHLLERTFYYRTICPMPDNELVRLVEAAGHSIRFFPRRLRTVLRSLNVFKYGRKASSLGVFYEMLPFLYKNAAQYDIFHCHFGANGILAALLKEVGATNARVVTTFHGEAGHAGEKQFKGFERLFKVGDLFLPMSAHERDNLIRLGCSETKTRVHRMGIDTARFSFAPRAPDDDGTIRLLTIARLVGKKGVEYGIRAVAQVLQRHPRIKYAIAGAGPLQDHLQSLIDDLGVNDRIEMLGWKRQEEIVELTNQAHILLAPSVTASDGDKEGLPIVLVEALARGLPVLSTYHSGIPELVQDGKTGFLVPERDVTGLAEKLQYLVEHPQIWPALGQAGRQRVEQHHDIHTLNDRLVERFTALLSETR